MNERERIEFDIVVGHLYKNMGDDLMRKLRPGFEYYRSLEGKYIAVCVENASLEAEVAKLKSHNACYVAGDASTTELKSPMCSREDGSGKCRKSKMCENWDPEPQTPGEGSGAVGAALEHHKVHGVEVGEEDKKKSIWVRLFGG
jgi:hypothetical protein